MPQFSQWEAAALFASPLIKVRVEGVETVRDYFHDRIAGSAQHRDDAHGQHGALSHYHSRGNVFDAHSDLAPLRDRLRKIGDFVYQELLNYADSGDLRLTNAWFNLAQLGASQAPHAHTNALLCGTLYLHADAHTHLDFHHPLKAPSAHAELYDEPAATPNPHGLGFHKRTSRIRVGTGDCLFWPAALRHGYTDNRTPNRLTLSFNMVPTRLNVDYQPFANAAP